MSKGYFIGLDDKTTCGGKVRGGIAHIVSHGRHVAARWTVSAIARVKPD